MWYILLAFAILIGLGSLAVNIFLFLLSLVVILSFLAGYKVYEWLDYRGEEND